MKKIASLSLLCLLSLSMTVQSPEVKSAIDAFLAGLPDKAEVAVGIVHNGEEYRYGYIKEDGQVREADQENAIFEVGSITKTLTATLLMEQVEKGEMELGDPIQQYLPVSMKQPTCEGHAITLKHLVTHTSGLNPAPGSFLWPYLKSKLFAPQNPIIL
ncbi:MAG: beta-lactamase family protein [Phaeodactylibacter sp.]|nr:beta-lactamase family protein [Phaeodactylibacter sp.]